MNRTNRRNTSIATMMLLYQLFVTANESGIPPVTLTFIGAQILLFLRILQVPWNDPVDICLSVDRIWFFKDYKRLIFAAFEHGDDFHLYYNMISFMWKGKTLEKVYGSGYFCFMLLVFTALTNLTYLVLNYIIGTVFFDESFFYSCAVGFSGTLFALKVVSTSLVENAYGSYSFASKYGVWVELFYISFISPNASFVGHLAGILVGLFYVNGFILKPIMENMWSGVMSIWNLVNPPNPNRNREEDYYDDAERFRRQQQQRYAEANYNNYGFGNTYRRRPGFGFGFSPMF